MPAGIYIHVPFCLAKCPYCDFYSVERDDDLINDFVNSLLAEIDIIAKTKWKDRVYNSIFFGGGTPPLIGAANISAVIEHLRGTFNISPRSEISIEINPETGTADFFKAIHASGVNRVSIGVQSFDDDLLRTLGRIHDAAKANQAVDNALAAGFENVGIDLIFGIPGQTVDSWRATLRHTLAKKPAHISAYGLTIEHGTPYYRMIEKGELILPENEVQAEMYLALVETIAGDGFNRYEVSNFARRGYECQHNFKYWRDDKYLGLGPSAHSYDGDTRSANAKSLDKYIAAIRKGKPPTTFKEKLTDLQKAEERLLLGLRLAEGIEYNFVREAISDKALGELKDQGYIIKKLNNLVLTDKGFLVADDIIVKLLKK